MLIDISPFNLLYHLFYLCLKVLLSFPSIILSQLLDLSEYTPLSPSLISIFPCHMVKTVFCLTEFFLLLTGAFLICNPIYVSGAQGEIMQGIKRADIKTGLLVRVVTKEDQHTGRLTEGVVKDILTKSPIHPHGIKVRLESGIVGRVKDILS